MLIAPAYDENVYAPAAAAPHERERHGSSSLVWQYPDPGNGATISSSLDSRFGCEVVNFPLLKPPPFRV